MKPSSTAAPDNRLAATNAAAAAAISRPFTNKQPLPIIPRSTTTFPPQQPPRHSSSYSQPSHQQQQRPRLFAPRNPNPQFIRNPIPQNPNQIQKQIQNPQNPNQNPQNQNQNQNQNQHQNQQQQHMIYPVVSSGRGYRAIRPEQSVSVANRGGGGGGGGVAYHPRPPMVVFHNNNNNQTASRGFVFSNSESLNQPVHMIAPPYVQLPSAGAALPPIRGIPVSSHPNQVASSLPIISNSNGYKDSRERSKEDPFVTFRDRKVRIKDGTSLYALCRSWLKNGSHEESQPQDCDGAKCLPRTLPLPIPARDSHMSTKKEVEQYEDRENEESVENLSAEEILQRHIKRARRVRSRLREERLQRILRYRARLANILPTPPVDQNSTDDPSA